MDRHLLKCSLMALSCFALNATCFAEMPVVDINAFAQLYSISQTVKKTLEAADKSVTELKDLNKALGDKISPGMMNRLSQASVYSREFSGLMDAFNGQGDPLAKMNYIGRQHMGTQDCSNYLYAKDYFQKKLFADRNSVTGQKPQIQEIQTKRLDALETSTVDSLAMATHQKRTLPQDHQALKDLSKQANVDDKIQYQMGVQTRLLEQIAYRLEKLVAIQAQQLELIAAFTANTQPVISRQVGGN